MADADFAIAEPDSEAAARLDERAPAGIAERLKAAVGSVPRRVVFTTAFGIEDQLIAHHIFTERLPIDVVTLDTGRLFPETYKTWQETEEKYGSRILAVHPEASALADLIADQGINGFYYSKDARLACCHIRKVIPLQRALEGAAGWVTGLRADQSDHRSTTQFAVWDEEHALIKFAPLFDYTRSRIVADCVKLGVPVNELHSRGYPSIGCAPCTRAIKPGEHERAGRWWWENDAAKECGLHVDASGRLVRSAAA